MVFRDEIEVDAPFTVHLYVAGRRFSRKVQLKVLAIVEISSDEGLEHNLYKWEGTHHFQE
ncbi:MAG TPA: hypothetical protein VMV56_05245 [Williamwhitmania sp.]|nr:hypothetical protein [Williamwhitmania sp.]